MRIWILVFALLLSGCNLFPVSPPTPPQVIIPSITPPPIDPRAYVPAVLPGGMVDALPFMSDICFEAAFDAAGHLFVLRNEQEQLHLFDLADHSRLCSRPIQRHLFDFSGGMVLAGLWSRGSGCTANHEVLAYQRDDSARQVNLMLRLVTQGSCPYELVRPFWVGIPAAQDYAIHIEVQETQHQD